MRAALDYLIVQGTQRIMLDASSTGRELYERMGFRRVAKIERWEGRASTYLGPRSRRIQPEDHDLIIALDTRMFGTSRAHILRRYFEEFPTLGWIDGSGDQIEGFLLGRHMTNTVHLGPWMCWTTAAAERLLRIAFEQLQGEHVTFNIPDSNGRSLVLVRDHNLHQVRYCTRMIYGDARPLEGELLTELAVASLATG